MEKILSLVIPTYNMEKYLDKCLTSLIMPKNMDDLEVLIVNDGSKDHSLEIAYRYSEKYPNTFIVIDKENGNYGSCINSGLKKATGRYFKVLDADDTFNTENLSDFIEFLRNLHVDLIMSDLVINDIQKGTIHHITYNLPVSVPFSFDDFEKRNVPYMWMHAVTHLTEKMRRIGYHQQEGISYTDKEFVFYPMAVSQTVAYFPKIIYEYTTGREGQTIDENVWIKNYWMEVKAVKKLLEIYVVHKENVSESGRHFMEVQSKLYIGSIYRHYIQMARRQLPIGELIEFDKWLEISAPGLYHCVDLEEETAHFYYISEWRKYKANMRGYLVHRFMHRIKFYIMRR